MNPQDISKVYETIKTDLEPLAAKLGQGASYMFELFVKQVYVNAITGMLWIIPGIICAVMAVFFIRLDTQHKLDRYDEGIGCFVGMLFTVAALALILVPISSLIAALINPQYQALQLIMETIKNSK